MKTTVALVIGILIGTLVGFIGVQFTGLSSAKEPYFRGKVDPLDVPDQTVSENHKETPLESDLAPNNRANATPEPVGSSQTKVREAELREWLQTLPAQKTGTPSGHGSIGGMVQDSQGVPLAGVTLRLIPRAQRTVGSYGGGVGKAAPSVPTLAEALRKAAERYYQTTGSTLETQTEESGEFRFSGIADLDWNLFAYLEGYRLEKQAGRPPHAPGETINFVAHKLTSFPVHVYDSDGTLVSDAVIRAKKTDGGTQHFQWDQDNPTIGLDAGVYTLTAQRGDASRLGGSAMASEEQRLQVHRDSAPTPLRFNLRPILTIGGLISLPAEDLRPKFYRARLWKIEPDQEFEMRFLETSRQAQLVLPEDGEYQFTDLDPGKYAVGVSLSSNGAVEQHKIVELSDTPIRCDFQLPPLDPSDCIRVAVQGPDGVKLAEVKCNLTVFSESRSESLGTGAVSDQEGGYLLRLTQKAREDYFGTHPQYKYTLKARHKDYPTKRVFLIPGQREITLEFRDPGRLRASILGYQGSGFEGRLALSVFQTPDDPNQLDYVRGDNEALSPSGGRTFSNLEPGEYTMQLSVLTPGESGRGGPKETVVARKAVTVRSGKNDGQIAIPPLYELRVKWPNGKPGSSLALSPADPAQGHWTLRSESLGNDERVLFTNLVAGEYRLHSRGTGAKPMAVTVPSGEILYDPATSPGTKDL